MANALDRVKAAEAKYAAMGETAEKLESTLKNFKGTADLCYAAMRELHREIKKDQKDQRWAFWWFVLMAGIVAFAGGFLGNFLREWAVRTLDVLGAWWGKLMRISAARSAAPWGFLSEGVWNNRPRSRGPYFCHGLLGRYLKPEASE